MTTIFGLSGSLRRASFNAGLLRAAGAHLPEGCQLTIGTISGVPLYDGDLEAAGTPEAVLSLREQIAAADGLLLATPEYNNGIPGVFKNAIDWIASGEGAKVFAGKPVAIMGASPMRFGTMLAQNAWLPILRALKAQKYHEGRLLVSNARKIFDDAGDLNDEETSERLRVFIHGFVSSLEA